MASGEHPPLAIPDPNLTRISPESEKKGMMEVKKILGENLTFP
jgi:hypothetical protein